MRRASTQPTLNDLRAFYDGRFRNNDLRDSSSFYKWVLERLEAQPGQSLLDVACGSGRLVEHARRTGLRAIALDCSIEALKRECEIDPGTHTVLADGQCLPLPDNAFDFVANLGSLEHFLDPVMGIREMARVLRHDGVAAILLPNAFYLADLIWWVWRRGRSPSHNQMLERFAAYADWRDLLEANGLKVKKGLKYNFMFPRTRLDWMHYRRFPRKLLNVAISAFVPFHFSYSFLYLCAKGA
jgi:SAM-dependent methyltransferase